MLALALALPWIAAVVAGGLDGRRTLVARGTVAVLAAHVAVLAVLLARVVDGDVERVVTGGWPAGVGIVLRADALGTTFALLSAIVLLGAMTYESAEGVRLRIFPALVLALDAGLTGLFLTGDVFSFYVFFELAMIAAYVLTATGEDRQHLGAAFIFAVVNLLGSFVFLISIAGLYHVSGTLAMEEAAARISAGAPPAALLIAVGFFVAFGVKLGLFPFHFWLPPVYIGARPAVAAVLSGALANIGSYGILRFGGEVLPAQLEAASLVLLLIGAASIAYGALQAISRRAAQEVLAYSTIGQVGYVLVAVAVGGTVGFAAAILYAVVNSLNKTLLFLAGGVRGWLVGAAFAVGALSVAGVPPAAGFVGKVALVRTGIEAESAAIVALVVAGSALSFVYMFQTYQHGFWRHDHTAETSARSARGAALAVAGLVLVLGLWPEPLWAVSEEAAGVLGAAP